ncbi:hypothetical protein EUGRSUZ_F00495 [Eucalyptus grandis]|uniref:Uncharacterized protein n=2 Tax=Eucalyptus grandis TaxID=71139 RepID=A0ACC3KC42_EUCGR|nr:hypothetical protein EUGRSUZ_F00495 [Eucalyptus grandis]
MAKFSQGKTSIKRDLQAPYLPTISRGLEHLAYITIPTKDTIILTNLQDYKARSVRLTRYSNYFGRMNSKTQSLLVSNSY